MKDIMDDKDYFLAKWLNNDLSQEEADRFLLHEDYESYVAIVDGIKKLKVPNQKSNEEEYLELMQRIESSKNNVEKSKVRKLNFSSLVMSLSIAASLLLLAGFSFVYFMGNVISKTNIAETKSIILPDNSKVVISASSELEYNKYLFYFSRKLSLKGEGYFSVEKGNKFTVNTNNGSVTVLGTKFNVVSRKDNFTTQCFEGSVRVGVKNESTVIKKGDKISYINSEKRMTNETDLSPKWISLKKSQFDAVPFGLVIQEFQNYYPVTFKAKDSRLLNLNFTGSFPYNSLEIALKSIFVPMGIKYRKEGEIIYFEK